MIKQFLLGASLLIAPVLGAQTSQDPNRVLLNFPGGFNYKSFVIDNVDSITFARVEGEVAAKIKIIEVGDNELTLDIERTDACSSFLINVIPQSIANQVTDNDPAMFNYLTSLNSPRCYDDYLGGKLTGLELVPGGEYSVVTAAYDDLGTEVGISRADFKAKTPELVGNPQVTAELVESTLNSFTVKFTPNDDVAKYYTVAGEKGTIQSQYEMFGPMFGATCIEQLIQMWGIETVGEKTETWDNMAPNTDYEVFVVSLDENGTYAPMQIFEYSTLSQGGTGAAYVNVTPTKYELADWGGEQKPSLYIKFEPNDQAYCYRFNVAVAANYEADKEGYKEALCSDPPMPTAYWFFYEPMETDFQVDPNTDIVILAAAKNSNNEWGEVNEYRYTTPATVDGAAKVAPKAAGKGILPRLVPGAKTVLPGSGCIPSLKKAAVSLSH